MMRKLIVCAAGWALCATGALAQQQQQQQPQQEQQIQRQQRSGQEGSAGQQGQQQAPEGYVYVREDVVYLLANEPQPHLTAALARYAAGDKQAAAQEMKIAAAYLDMQASRGPQQGADDQKLKDASQRLKRLADRFASKGQQQGEQGGQGQQQQQQQEQAQAGQGGQGRAMDLHRTFARVNAALASHFNSLAKSELQNKKYIAAGYDLNAAATSLAQAYSWTRQQPQDQTLDNAGIVASNLVGEDISAALRQARQGSSSSSGANANANANSGSENARTAGARLNPITGTTPAEAQNIVQHAQTICSALDQDIQQLESHLGQGGNDQHQQHHQGSQEGQGSSSGSSSSSSSSGSGQSGSSSQTK